MKKLIFCLGLIGFMISSSAFADGRYGGAYRSGGHGGAYRSGGHGGTYRASGHGGTYRAGRHVGGYRAGRHGGHWAHGYRGNGWMWVGPAIVGGLIVYEATRQPPPQTIIIQQPVKPNCSPWTEIQNPDGTITRTRTCNK